MRINRRLLCLGLSVVFGLCGAAATKALAQGTNAPEFNVSPGSNEGAGFGETAPTPQQLRVRLNFGTAQTMVYCGVADATGTSMWQLESQGLSSRVFVSSNNLEDARGCITGTGIFMSGWSFTTPATVSLANVRFPSGGQVCDPANPASCNSPPTTEGEVLVRPGGQTTVSLTVHHVGPGRVTAWSENPDITIVNASGVSLAPDPAPLTRDGEPVTGSGASIHAVPLTIRAASGFSGQTTITARFIPDNGAQGRDAQDKLIVKKRPDCAGVTLTVLGKPVTDGQTVYVAKGPGNVDVVAHPDPPGASFGSGEPIWTAAPSAAFTVPALPDAMFFPTDQPSANTTGETFTATACGGSATVKIVVVELEVSLPAIPIIQDEDDLRTEVTATVQPAGLFIRWTVLANPVDVVHVQGPLTSGTSILTVRLDKTRAGWNTWSTDTSITAKAVVDPPTTGFPIDSGPFSVPVLKFKRGGIFAPGSDPIELFPVGVSPLPSTLTGYELLNRTQGLSAQSYIHSSSGWETTPTGGKEPFSNFKAATYRIQYRGPQDIGDADYRLSAPIRFSWHLFAKGDGPHNGAERDQAAIAVGVAAKVGDDQLSLPSSSLTLGFQGTMAVISGTFPWSVTYSVSLDRETTAEVTHDGPVGDPFDHEAQKTGDHTARVPIDYDLPVKLWTEVVLEQRPRGGGVAAANYAYDWKLVGVGQIIADALRPTIRFEPTY